MNAVPNLNNLLAVFASAFTQDRRLVTLHLGEDESLSCRLLPQMVAGEEALSACYRMEVRCLSPDGAIPLKSLLGLPARLGVLMAESGVVSRCGVVTAARSLAGDGGFAAYELVIEPPLALLRHRRASRVYQDLSVPDIIKSLVAEHQARNPIFGAFFALRFDLRETRMARSYCLQYRETDLEFFDRLLREEGIAYRFEHEGGDGDGDGVQRKVTLVAFDDAYALPQCEQGWVRFHRADATEADDTITDWSSERQLGESRVSIASYDYKPVSVHKGEEDSAIDQGVGGHRAEFGLDDYDAQSLYYGDDADGVARYARLRQQAHDRRKKTFKGEGSIRALQVGHWFVLSGHPQHDHDAPEQREFVASRLSFAARNNLPGGLQNLVCTTTPDAGLSANVTEPFKVTFEAQRRGIHLTPDYAHSVHSRPTARGPQTAVVVGPAGEEIHTDSLGRIKVQFHWQRQSEHPESGAANDDRSSCWLRVVHPSAGANWGHQFIPRVGQEVLVDFIENDIDRPLVVGVLYNGSHGAPSFSGAGSLPANKTLSGIKSKEYKGDQYNELLFDDTAGEVRARFSTEHASTQLNLGYLVHPRKDGRAEPRGEGAELRSDAAIALRAARGMLFSACGEMKGSGSQLARGELIELLGECAELFKSLGDYAQQYKAMPADSAPQAALAQAVTDWENGSNTLKKAQNGGKPAICAVAPEGLGFATPKTIVSYAGLNHDLTAQHHLQVTAGERFAVNAGAGISLFSQSQDVRMIAHQGQCLLQAQNNDIVGQAERNVMLSASEGEVLIMAPKIRLVAEDGSFIRIGGGITLGTTGAVQVKAASQSMSGPATDSANLPTFGVGKADQRFMLHYPALGDARPQFAANRKYEITLKDGRVVSGVSDGDGRTSLVDSDAMQIAKVRILGGDL